MLACPVNCLRFGARMREEACPMSGMERTGDAADLPGGADFFAGPGRPGTAEFRRIRRISLNEPGGICA